MPTNFTPKGVGLVKAWFVDERKPRMSLHRWLAAVTILIICAACGGEDAEIAGPTWNLTELQGSAPIDGTSIDLTITEDGVSGTSGCNRYMGPVTVDGNQLTLGPDLASTMMACAEDVMAQETEYLEALSSVTTYEISGDELLLMDSGATVVARFE